LENEENKVELARYTKNFLLILLNLYTTVPAGPEEARQMLASLETIKLYFMISDTELVNTMIKKHSEFITFNIYLWGSSTKTVEEPIEEDKEEVVDEEEKEEEEKKRKPMKVDKTTWDWELCNEPEPI
jgi:hypothetical protein